MVKEKSKSCFQRFIDYLTSFVSMLFLASSNECLIHADFIRIQFLSRVLLLHKHTQLRNHKKENLSNNHGDYYTEDKR